MKNINLILFLVVNVLFYSCSCEDYNIEPTKVQSIKINYLIEKDSVEISEKEIIHDFIDKINQNCYQVFTKRKLIYDFEITFRINEGVKKDSFMIRTGGQYFDVYIHDSILGNYKMKNDLYEYLYNFSGKEN